MLTKFDKQLYEQEYKKNPKLLSYKFPPVERMELVEFVSWLSKRLYIESLNEYKRKYLNLRAIHLDVAYVIHQWIQGINYYVSFDDTESIDPCGNYQEYEEANKIERILTLKSDDQENDNENDGHRGFSEDINSNLNEWSKKECWNFYKGQLQRILVVRLPDPLTRLVTCYVNDPAAREKFLKEQEQKKKTKTRKKQKK